jgi:hypothetical protein
MGDGLAIDCIIDFATSYLGDRAEDHILLNYVSWCVIVVWKTGVYPTILTVLIIPVAYIVRCRWPGTVSFA